MHCSALGARTNGKIRLVGFRMRARSVSNASNTAIIYRRTSRSLVFVSSPAVDGGWHGTGPILLEMFGKRESGLTASRADYVYERQAIGLRL